MLRGLPDLPLQLLLDALVGGVALHYDPYDLERDLVVAADATRSGGTWRAFAGCRLSAVEDCHLAYDGESWHPAAGGDHDVEFGTAVVSVGSGPSGAFVRAAFDSDDTPWGTRSANAPCTSGGTPTATSAPRSDRWHRLWPHDATWRPAGRPALRSDGLRPAGVTSDSW